MRTKALIPCRSVAIADICYRDVLRAHSGRWPIKDKSTYSHAKPRA